MSTPSLQPALQGEGGIATGLRQRLQAWVQGVLGDVPITHEAPGAPRPAGRCVGLYLMALTPAAGTRGNVAPPLQFGVRYLVTTWGDDAAAAHEDLYALAFSAIESPAFEADFEAMPPAAWTAFGVAPRPAFAIGLPLRQARPRPATTPVRMPLVLAPAPMGRLDGVVLGPEDTPLADARVELLTLGVATRSDAKGCFTFTGVPAGPALRLRVRARGVAQTFALPAVGGPGERVPLRLVLD